MFLRVVCSKHYKGIKKQLSMDISISDMTEVDSSLGTDICDILCKKQGRITSIRLVFADYSIGIINFITGEH